MKYDNIFPTGILVHDVPVWVAKQVEKLVEERVDKLQSCLLYTSPSPRDP